MCIPTARGCAVGGVAVVAGGAVFTLSASEAANGVRGLFEPFQSVEGALVAQALDLSTPTPAQDNPVLDAATVVGVVALEGVLARLGLRVANRFDDAISALPRTTTDTPPANFTAPPGASATRDTPNANTGRVDDGAANVYGTGINRTVTVDTSRATRGTPEYDLLNNPPANTRVELDNGTTFRTNEAGYVDEIS